MTIFACVSRVATAALIAGSAVVAPRSAEAQTLVYGDTLVEILGLRSWTPQRVEAAVKRFAPKVSLASAACAVILRDSVGFADAAVLTARFAGSDTVWTTIRVVEPSDSSLVRYTGSTRIPISIPAAWADLNAAFARSPALLSHFQHPEFLIGDADSVFGAPVPAEALAVRAALRVHHTASDRAAVLDILLHSSNPAARQTAALVASNFPSDHDIWYALVEAFRARSDYGATAAQMIFSAMARTRRYTVEWQPAADALSAVIGGTNLFAYDKLLSGLVDTGIDRHLARNLTRVNPTLLADHTTARNPMLRSPARRYLFHAGSPDFGDDREAWLRWIRQ